jgi:cysteinyl-tRNA synthetase
MIKQRNTARKNKDFAAADSLRDQLTKMGVTIKDGPDGTNWEYN